MNIEAKLDEDFIFYLGFTKAYTEEAQECDRNQIKRWLHKLCGSKCETVDQKRNRNIFLSNLLLDLQDKKLTGPFLQKPEDVPLSEAPKYFPQVSTDEIIAPSWLGEGETDEAPVSASDEARIDGRTYVATRAMPGGEGAFAYVAIDMSNEPMWLGGTKRPLDKLLERKFAQVVPPQTEMELILARRKDPKERQRVITFYEVIMKNISDELDGKILPKDNPDITTMLEQLAENLRRSDQYRGFDILSEGQRRIELMFLLFDKAAKRKRQTATREEILDHVGADLANSFLETSLSGAEDRYEMPPGMWDYCINRPPNRKNVDRMRTMYPPFVIERFLRFLANAKEDLAARIARRSENIITQMKRDLAHEGAKLNAMVHDIQVEADRIDAAEKDVSEAYEMYHKYVEESRKPLGGITKLTQLYTEMRVALMETQASVEQEAERGRFLAEQINAVNAQTEAFHEVSERTITMTEQANMELMKNCKRLMLAVKQNEARIQQILSARERRVGHGGAGRGVSFIF